MPLDQIPDLAFGIDGDLINLEQNDNGNVDTVVLHRLHVAHLAGLLGLVPPVPRPAAPKAITGGPEGMDSLEVSTDDDGTIWLSQTRVQGMGGTDVAVALHPIQAAWLAEQLGASASAIVSPNGQQARALRRLWAKLDLLTSDCWMSEIVERCGDGLVYQTYALDAHNILADLLEDLGLEGHQGDEPTEAARQAGALTAAKGLSEKANRLPESPGGTSKVRPAAAGAGDTEQGSFLVERTDGQEGGSEANIHQNVAAAQSKRC